MVSVPSINHKKCPYSPPVPCGIWWHILHFGAHEEGHSPSKLEKPGRRALRACYKVKIHSHKIMASQRILKHAPTQGGLTKILDGSIFPRSIFRGLYPLCTQQHIRRSFINVGNRCHIIYYKPLYYKGDPSIRVESPGEPLQYCTKPYWC